MLLNGTPETVNKGSDEEDGLRALVYRPYPVYKGKKYKPIVTHRTLISISLTHFILMRDDAAKCMILM